MFAVIAIYCSLVDMFWKTEVIGELYLVRSADKTWVVRWLSYILGIGSNWQAVLRSFRRRKRGWLGGCHIFWVSEVIGKPYYVRSADQNVGGSVGVCFVLFQVVDSFFCCGLWRQGGQSWEAKAGELVTFKLLIFVGIYILTLLSLIVV